MSSKHKTFRPQFRLLALLAAFFLEPATQAQQTGMKDMLDAYDQAFLSACTLNLTATYPTTAFDSRQGRSAAAVHVTSDGKEQALQLEDLQMDPPVFSAHRLERDYDNNGNLVLSHHKRTFVFLGTESWKCRFDPEEIRVDSSGKVAGAVKRPPHIDSRPVGHPDSANYFYRFVLPLGRGFSRLIETVTGIEAGENGIANVTARGTMFSPNVGTWQLEVDTGHDYLIRRAEFLQDGANHSSVMSATETAGISKGDIPLYREGSFALASDYVINVTLIDYTNAVTPALISDVRLAVDTLAEDWTLLDFGRTNENGSPFVVRGAKVP